MRVWDIATRQNIVTMQHHSYVPVLALSGALAKKKRIPVSAGTLPTHTPLFGAVHLNPAAQGSAVEQSPPVAGCSRHARDIDSQ